VQPDTILSTATRPAGLPGTRRHRPAYVSPEFQVCAASALGRNSAATRLFPCGASAIWPGLKATEVAVVLIRPAQGRIEINSSPLVENARVEWQSAEHRPRQVDVNCGVGLTRVSIEKAIPAVFEAGERLHSNRHRIL
jgi:hypothetical protein